MRTLSFLSVLALVGCKSDVNIRENERDLEDPEITILYPTANTEVAANTPFTLVALALDEYTVSEDLTVVWISDRDGLIEGVWSWDGAEVSLEMDIGLSSGQHSLTANVADEDGGEGQDTVVINAIPNDAPIVAFTAPATIDPAVFRTEDSYRMTLIATDDLDSPVDLDVEWSGTLATAFTLPPQFNPDGTLGVTLSELDAGTYTVGVTVRDRFGAEGFAEAFLTVVVDSDNDGVVEEDDCDDNDPNSFPGAEDICDGIDNDCDGIIDNDAPEWFADTDDDGFGAGDAVAACEMPDGHVADATDCDDTNVAVFPGADELCNGIDDDCNTLIDDDPIDATLWYVDGDADDFGDPGTVVEACDAPGGNYIDMAGDCLDSENTVYPGADELCDGLDNDCDTLVDEEPPTWYDDSDGDLFGDFSTAAVQCDPPTESSVQVPDDCDDTNLAVFPGADELCNGIDDDCNDLIDDDPIDATPWYVDSDADDFGDPATLVEACDAPGDNYIDMAGDCLDSENTVYPGADEICDGLDNDCDELVDEEPPEWFADTDDDGFGAGDPLASCDVPDGHVADATDCDDTNVAVFPGANELCNGIDDDCNELIDDAPIDATLWYVDGDADDFGDPATLVEACDAPGGNYIDMAGDCLDSENTVYPGADEICDGLDNDCDELVDEEPPTWYADNDGDLFGDFTTAAVQCDPPTENSVQVPDDCDDTLSTVNPDATDICNGIDDDCNGFVDDDLDEGFEWFVDLDGDGFGDPEELIIACDAPDGTVDRPFDCDDSDPARNPTAPELCNGLDDDCDGEPEVALWVGEGHPYDIPSAAVTAARFGDLICVDEGIYDSVIDFRGKSLRMQGVDRDSVIVQSAVGPRFVDGENSSSLLAYMTIRGMAGQNSADKGILYISGASPVIRDVRFTDFSVSSNDHFSGARISRSGTVMEDVVFDNISATRIGSEARTMTAGISASSWTGSAHGLTIERVTAEPGVDLSTGLGTAMRLNGCDVLLEDVTLLDNIGNASSGSSGTIYIDGGSDVEFIRLTAIGNIGNDGDGGVLGIRNSRVTIDGGRLADNETNGVAARGGAISINSSTLIVNNVDFVSNRVVGTERSECGGGAIGVRDANESFVSVRNSSFYDNFAICGSDESGGALWSPTSWTVELSYTNSFGNGSQTYANVSSGSFGAGMTSADPGYRNVFSSNSRIWDFGLVSSSPLIDAGDPAVTDVDGSRSNVGSLGGPYGVWPTD